MRRKTVKMAFDPAGTPNVYRARTSGDPMSEDGYVWARLKDRTLTVNIMAVRADGGYDVQTFDRELSAAGMALRFVRVRDGRIVREVNGKLIKTGK